VEYFVIKSKEKAEELCRIIRHSSLPFKFAIQEILPTRSIESNDYYWGFIVTPVANHTGHTTDEIHEIFKRMFNFKLDLRYNKRTRKMIWYVGAASTAGLDEKEIWEYIEKCRIEAWHTLEMTLLLPNEVWTNKLDFSKSLKTI
jgi:hypothetical protein